MTDLIRDAPIGQLIRYITGNKFLQYPEERQGFVPPSCYYEQNTLPEKALNTPQASSLMVPTPSPSDTSDLEKMDIEEKIGSTDRNLSLTRTLTDASHRYVKKTDTNTSALCPVSSRVALEKAVSHADLEQAFVEAIIAEDESPKPVQAEKLDDGTVLIHWYSTKDPDNPQNWSTGKKAFVSFLICIYTTGVYSGSAIYAPSIPGVMERFDVGHTAAALGLALYVLAYGIGPLIFSPIQEIPRVGRNTPYIISFAIFVIICVPTALVDNFAGLLVLRFLQGFFGSPCLATGGATLQDMYSLIKLPYVLTCWAAAACVGPALGPIVSGFSVSAMNWRWSLWEILWLAGPIWLMMFFFLPETLPENILLRRAERLRSLTGENRYKALSETKKINPGKVIREALIKPVQLMVMDPAIAYADIYIALCYGIFYSFFEVFPVVYIERYGFNMGEMGLTFLSITAGVVISVLFYFYYLYYYVEPEIRAHGLGAPERRLIPALYTSFFIPIGLFIFAWTGDGHIHWIVSCIGIVITVIGIFIIFQCVFIYLPLTYPAYSASLFAGNDFVRSVTAFSAILFSRPLFNNLGVGPGVSLLASLAASCIIGIFVLFFYGHKLRARSRFAAK